jgi:hypothetical protein
MWRWLLGVKWRLSSGLIHEEADDGNSGLMGCVFVKWWYPKIIHFNRTFHYSSCLSLMPCLRNVKHQIVNPWTEPRGMFSPPHLPFTRWKQVAKCSNMSLKFTKSY